MLGDSQVEKMQQKFQRIAATQIYDKLCNYQYSHCLEPSFTALKTHAIIERSKKGA